MDNFIPLEAIEIASPCRADWNAMRGDDRARFCSTCRKNVYNLSELSKAQAQALVAEKEGRLCVRFYRRADGTMITDDCPVPLRPARNGARRLWHAVGAVATALAASCSGLLVVGAMAKPAATTHPRAVKTSRHVAGRPKASLKARAANVPKRTVVPPSPQAMMGDVAAPITGRPAPPAPTPTPVAPVMGEAIMGGLRAPQ
jgi:hypothetical protein